MNRESSPLELQPSNAWLLRCAAPILAIALLGTLHVSLATELAATDFCPVSLIHAAGGTGGTGNSHCVQAR